MTRRLSIDRLRENTAAKRGGGKMSTAIDELADCLAAPGTVEADVEARALSAAIDRFLDGLKEADRSFFVPVLAGRAIAEIAKRRGVRRAGSKARLCAAAIGCGHI